MSSKNNTTAVYKSVWFDRFVATIGLDATRKLITRYGGKTIRLPRVNVFLQKQRNIMITKDFLTNKYKKKELGAKWGLHPQTISKIVESTLNDPGLKNLLE